MKNLYITLQKLLDICCEFAEDNELKYNVKKSVCMSIKPKWLKNITVPTFYIGNIALNSVAQYKYLGVLIADSFKDNIDIKRQVRAIYSRGNSLIKRFSFCSDDVKLKLFKSYCTSFYCSALWSQFNKASITKLSSAYHRVFRKLLKVHDKAAALQFMTENNTDVFKVLQRKLILSFRKRIHCSENVLVNVITKSLYFNNCTLNTFWNTALFAF